MSQKLKEKTLESLAAVLPITLIVLVLSVLLVPMALGTMTMFLAGSVMLVIGMGLFQMGSEMAMTPLGEGVGVETAKAKKLSTVLLIAFFMGMIVTIAEPDLQVLAQQVPSIPNAVLVYSIAVGVGLFLALAMLRIVRRISLSGLLMVLYAALILLSFFVPKAFLPVAFDSGGVASGPMTTTFLLPLGIGACQSLGGDLMTDAFGVVALTPLIAVQIMGVAYRIKLSKAKKCMVLVPHAMDDADDIIELEVN